jgi:DNA-binding response OmpR family regulator
MKILVAEDDPFTRNGLAEIFREEGYSVVAAEDGATAVEMFRKEKPDIVILDIMMPGRNGYDVCKIIRRENGTVPVIFLSAKSEEIDKVLGLELGADDYISKPFGVKEVIARVRAVLRRSGSFSADAEGAAGNTAGRVLEMGDLRVYPEELRALRGETEIELGLRDVKLLVFFAENRGKVLDRDALYNAGWGISHLPNSRTLDQHISVLRKKIEKDPKNPAIITTVHTAGYRYP